MVHGGVRESLHESLYIGRRVQPCFGQGRCHFTSEGAYEVGTPGGSHDISHGGAACSQTEVGNRGVRTIQQAQLHQLVGSDIRNEERAVALPLRTRRTEGVFEDPLPVRLTDDGHLIAEADRHGGGVAVCIGGGRHDAVDDGCRERHRMGHPLQQRIFVRPARCLDEVGHDTGQDRTVVGHVVAAHDVDGCFGQSKSGAQTQGDLSQNGQ